MSKISAAKIKTLATLSANGGEMNDGPGQKGFYTNSVDALIRMGLAERVARCASCRTVELGIVNGLCERPLIGQKGGESCYFRVRITDAGRRVLAGE